MDQLYQSLLLNRVPAEWVKFYANKRPLASWFSDLKERYNQLAAWVEEFQVPKSTCISYLFNPMSFLTAIMQVTAGKQNQALDQMALNTNVTKFMSVQEIKFDAPAEEDAKEQEEDEEAAKEKQA